MRYRVDTFTEISTDMLCPTYCSRDYITLTYPKLDRRRCQLYLGTHTTKNQRFKVCHCRVRDVTRCENTNVMCTNCKRSHYV